ARTTTAMTEPVIGYFLLFGHECGRAPDLDYLDLGPGLEHLILVIGARAPRLAADAHQPDVRVIVDALQHDPPLADQRSRPGARDRRHALVRARQRPQRGQ